MMIKDFLSKVATDLPLSQSLKIDDDGCNLIAKWQ